jgi:hypothetical protein
MNCGQQQRSKHSSRGASTCGRTRVSPQPVSLPTAVRSDKGFPTHAVGVAPCQRYRRLVPLCLPAPAAVTLFPPEPPWVSAGGSRTCPSLTYVAPSFSNSLRSTVCGGSSCPCSTCSCTRVATALAACRLLMKPLGPGVHKRWRERRQQWKDSCPGCGGCSWLVSWPYLSPRPASQPPAPGPAAASGASAPAQGSGEASQSAGQRLLRLLWPYTEFSGESAVSALLLLVHSCMPAAASGRHASAWLLGVTSVRLEQATGFHSLQTQMICPATKHLPLCACALSLRVDPQVWQEQVIVSHAI